MISTESSASQVISEVEAQSRMQTADWHGRVASGELELGMPLRNTRGSEQFVFVSHRNNDWSDVKEDFSNFFLGDKWKSDWGRIASNLYVIVAPRRAKTLGVYY